MRARPRISLCMIVRDEEEFFERCLESVRGAVDEVCVVDTGSRDRTVTIAREHGAFVHEVPWGDSFAEARNRSLALATGDWVLVLDADEALAQGAPERLRRIAADPGLAGALLRFTHHLDEGTQEGWLLRFFRRDPETYFVGAVHEQLCAGFEELTRGRGQRVLMSDVRVEHDGYRSAVGRRKRKDERNRRLFERARVEEPGNDYLAFKYGDFLRGAGERERAIEVLSVLCDRLLERSEDAPPQAFHSEAFALLALELLESGRVREAGERVEQAHGRFPATVHFCFVRGAWLLRRGRFGEALAAYEDGRALDGPASVHVPSPGVATWRSSLGISEALEGLDRRGEAERVLRDETRRSPEVPEVHAAYAALLAREGRLRAALQACMAGLQLCPTSAFLWRRCAELMLAGDFPGHARRAAEEALRFAPGGAERERARELLARCPAAA